MTVDVGPASIVKQKVKSLQVELERLQLDILNSDQDIAIELHKKQGVIKFVF